MSLYLSLCIFVIIINILQTKKTPFGRLSSMEMPIGLTMKNEKWVVG